MLGACTAATRSEPRCTSGSEGVPRVDASASQEASCSGLGVSPRLRAGARKVFAQNMNLNAI